MGERRAAGVLCHLLLSFSLFIIIIVICYCHYYYCFGFCAYHVACDDQSLKPHQLFKGLSVVLTKTDMQAIAMGGDINMTSRWNPSWTPWQEWNRLRPWPIVDEVSIA